MQRNSTSTRSLAIMVMLAVLVLGKYPVSASYAAVIVYDHGFTKQITWVGRGNALVNKNSNFTQGDPLVIAYAKLALYNASLTWQWYDPNGQLYFSATQEVSCNVAPCTFANYLPLKYTPAAILFGQWKVDLLANGFPLYSDYFWVNAIITQEDHWDFNVTQSAPGLVHGKLTIIVHPNNQTFSEPIQLGQGVRLETFYRLFMPYAANITA